MKMRVKDLFRNRGHAAAYRDMLLYGRNGLEEGLQAVCRGYIEGYVIEHFCLGYAQGRADILRVRGKHCEHSMKRR